MEPFKITCVSCRAVLTVRKESMIGQIIACPRCNMMVQVLPPTGYVAEQKPAAATPAPSAPTSPEPAVSNKTKAAATVVVATTLFDSTDALADISPPTMASATPAAAPAEPIATATFDDAVDAFSDPPASLKNPAPAKSSAPIASSTSTSDAALVDAAPPTAPSALPPAASRWATLKFPAMIAGGALAGAALVAMALTLFGGDEPTPSVTENTSASVPAEQQPTVNPVVTDANASPVAPIESPPTEQAGEEQAATSVAAVADSNIEPTAENPFAESPDDDGDSAETVPAESDNSEATAATEPTVPEAAGETTPDGDAELAAETAAADQPKLRIDPLDVDPEGLNLTTLYNGPPKDPIAASQLPEEEMAALSVPAAEEAPPDSALPVVGDANAAAPVRRDEQPGVAAPANVAALLARKTPKLKVQNMPLCRLLDLSVQMSGVPVSVAPEQLRLAAVSAGQPATADVKDATIEEFLTIALKPLRLQPVVVKDQIVLIRGSSNPRRSVTYAVDDLAGDAAAVERLAETIQKVVAPESWQSAGGAGTIVVDGKQLKIETGEAIQYEILLLLERSRAALGKSPRSKYPAALIGADAAPIALAERLNAPATFTFSQYTPLREIFRHWQEEMEVAVLVDWPALADLRLWPSTRIACSSANKPWDAALDEVLTPLGLAWRPIDKRTIEITTLEKASSAPLLEIYRLNPDTLAGVDDLATQMEQLAAADENAQNAHSGAIILDGEHHLLLVRQPATIQRQIAARLTRMQLLADSQPANGQ